MKHLARATWKYFATVTTSLPTQQYDSGKSGNSNIVVFDDKDLTSHNTSLEQFNNALTERTSTLAQKLSAKEVALEEAITNYDSKVAAKLNADEEKLEVRRKRENKNAAAKKLMKEEAKVYAYFAEKGNLSPTMKEAVNLLGKLKTSEREKPPVLTWLDTLPRYVPSEETKAALSKYHDVTEREHKSNAKADFVYLLTRDLAEDIGKNTTNKSARALSAKLLDDCDRKYWKTKKGKTMMERSKERAVSPDEYFFPWLIRQAVAVFSQLVVVDTVDEDDEDIIKTRQLLAEIKKAKGNDKKKLIKDLWN